MLQNLGVDGDHRRSGLAGFTPLSITRSTRVLRNQTPLRRSSSSNLFFEVVSGVYLAPLHPEQVERVIVIPTHESQEKVAHT